MQQQAGAAMGLMNGASERAGAHLVLGEVASYARELTGPLTPGQHLREICHDIRQPVAGVLSLAAAALTVPELPSAARSWLEQIVIEAESLAELINESLGGSRAGDKPRTDLGMVANQVVTGERLTYQGQLRMRAPARPVVTAVSRVDAWRIIANLLSNATRAAGLEGQVTVGVSRIQGHALLVVEDTGPGFARIPPGCGLGSTVMAECLIRCGGRIQYEPSKAGGVKATLSLPLADD
jgi:signal transduction histidine kinase